jgi:quercetin dioxygenase-like cupin family protein
MTTDQYWFLNSLVRVIVSHSQGPDKISILEHRVPHGDSPPLHFHRTEDEVFHFLEGEFRVKVRDDEQRIGAGAVILMPKNTPHTYRAESPQGGRFLTITVGGDFERFVRELGRPAERSELPTLSGPPSDAAVQALASSAAKHGIQIIGPPLG